MKRKQNDKIRNIDNLCPIGHNYTYGVKQRVAEYYEVSPGKSPLKNWIESIRDGLTQAIIYKRIRQATLGNFGDFKSVGSGVFEMRINHGPGFRIYYGIYHDEIILLLVGGAKRTQQSDIEKAKKYWMSWHEEKSNEKK